MGIPSKIVLIQDNEFSGSRLSEEIVSRMPQIPVLEDSFEIEPEDVPEIILLNGFPDKHYPVISKTCGNRTMVINFIPAGRTYGKGNYGFTHLECLYGPDDRGTTTIFLLGIGEPHILGEEIIEKIFPETPLNAVIKEDLELMVADLILRPLIAGLVMGRIKADSGSTYFSRKIISAGISPASDNIGFVRDTIRYNPYASATFLEIENSLKKTWNDLSNY